VLDRAYRQTKYALPGGEARGEVVETPFVGEALVRLFPQRFGRVHVFGTPDSMWPTLYRSAHEGPLGDEQAETFFHLADHVDRRAAADESAPAWRALEADLTRHFGCPTRCHTLPVPDRDAALWATLETVASLQLDPGTTVSMDATHGLRTQPLFMREALELLRAVQAIRIGSVFYGAYELRSEGNVAPVLEQRALGEARAWATAASRFDTYGDAGPLAELLQGHAQAGNLARLARLFSRSLQIGATQQLQRSASGYLAAASGLDTEAHPALPLLRPLLERFPARVAGADAAWEVALHAARHHADHARAGLAVLSLWEAIISRAADLYGVDRANFDQYQRLSGLVRSGRRAEAEPNLKRHLERFSDHAWKVYTYRNGIAHADETGSHRPFQPKEVYDNLEALLAYFEEALRADWLKRLPRALALDR
jgi:CRISPR-associated Csx2 family protein